MAYKKLIISELKKEIFSLSAVACVGIKDCPAIKKDLI